MKTIALLACGTVLLLSTTACRGPGGPGQRAGRAVDNAVSTVGTGVERTGQTVRNVATGN